MDPPLQAEIMTDEIFGPLLPIITVRHTCRYMYYIIGFFTGLAGQCIYECGGSSRKLSTQ